MGSHPNVGVKPAEVAQLAIIAMGQVDAVEVEVDQISSSLYSQIQGITLTDRNSVGKGSKQPCLSLDKSLVCQHQPPIGQSFFPTRDGQMESLNGGSTLYPTPLVAKARAQGRAIVQSGSSRIEQLKVLLIKCNFGILLCRQTKWDEGQKE